MIDGNYLQQIGLTEDQTTLLLDALSREARFRQILLQEGVLPKHVEKVVRHTRIDEIDFDNEPLLREKIRETWSGFMTAKDCEVEANGFSPEQVDGILRRMGWK